MSNWLNERKKGIGGSDIASILGLNKYSSPLQVYLSKVENYEIEETRPMRLGKLLEDIIAKEFSLETGYKIINPEYEIYTHKEVEFFKGSFDRFYIKDGERCILECKNTSKYVKDVEDSHYCQAQWYLGITGLETATVVYLLNHYDLKIFEFKRDNNFIQNMQNEATDFWNNYVLKMIPPPPMTAWDSMKLYPESNGTIIEANNEVYETYLELSKIKSEIKELDTKKENLETQLKCYFGESETLKYGDTKLMTFKTQTRESLDTTKLKKENPTIYNQYVKQTKYRVLR